MLNMRAVKIDDAARSEVRRLRGLGRDLDRIEFALRVRYVTSLGPRGAKAVLFALTTFIVFYEISHAVRAWGWPVPAHFLSIGFCISMLVMWLVSRYSKSPHTYTEQIYHILAAYHPVAVAAFCELQKNKDKFNSDLLRHWVWQEREAINIAVKRCSADSAARDLIARARQK
jgi:hypothetical protein